MAVICLPFWTNCRPVFKVQAIQEDRLTLELRPIGCPETSVNNYQYRSRHIPEGRRSCWHLEVSLQWLGY